MSCSNNIITSDNINESILVGPHESSTRIDRDSEFEVCSINFTCGITTPRIDGDVILGISTTLEYLEVLNPICAPIGQPSTCVTRPNEKFCETGGLALDHFSSQDPDGEDIGLPLYPETKIQDGFQLLDAWLKTYLMTQPPEVCLEERISCEVPETASSDYFTVHWNLPPRRCLGILDIQVPLINNVLIDFVESSKNPDCDFTHPDTLHITAPETTTTFQAFTDDGNGSLTSGDFTDNLGTTWRQYTVDPGVQYDIRVYGKNYNCEHEFNYMIEKNLCTLDVGIPSEPLNLTCGSEGIEQITLNWNAPLDNNDLLAGNNPLPTLEQYAIDYSATTTLRYGGLDDDQLGVTNALTGNTNTNYTVSGLNPGTTYEFQVSAKNVLNSTGGLGNDGFGPESNIVYCTTTLPDIPPVIGSINLANTGSLTYSGGGCNLSATQNFTYIYNWNLLDPSNTDASKQIRTNILTSRRNNQIPGSESLMTSTVRAQSGLESSYTLAGNTAEKDLNGFGQALGTGLTLTANNVTGLQITADQDYYTVDDFEGFWKDWNGYGIAYDLGITSEDATKLFYANYNRIYNMRMEQSYNEDGSSYNVNDPDNVQTVTTNTLEFVIDDLNELPGVTACGIYDVVGTAEEQEAQVEYVSGVPTWNTSATFNYRFTMEEIAHKFIRADKCHADVGLYLSDNTVVSDITRIDKTDNSSGSPNADTIHTSTSHRYYTSPGVTTGQQYYEISSTLHNILGTELEEDPGDIQFNDYTITFSSLADEVCDEDVRLRVTPCNLYGTGSYEACPYLDSMTGVTKLLRIDTCSTVCLATVDDSFDTNGELVSSGTGQYPDVNTGGVHATDVGVAYNHQLNLYTDLPEQLTLLAGRWQNPLAIDYNNYYFPSGTIIPDLSGITEDGNYRYVTFTYRRTGSNWDVQGTGKVTQERVRLTINDPQGLTLDLSQIGAANHRLYLKVTGYGSTPGDGDPNGYDTYWLDCTNTRPSIGIINGIISQNDEAIFQGDGVNCLNPTSTVSVRDCYIPIVTTEDARFYVRIGWQNDVDYNFACGISLEIIDGEFESFPP